MTSAVKFRANAGGAADGRSSLHAARAAAMRPRAMAARNAITQWRQDRRSDRGPLYRSLARKRITRATGSEGAC